MEKAIEEHIRKKYSKKTEDDYEKEFQEVRKFLLSNQASFNEPYILRQLHDNINLRAVFLAVLKTTPSRISEIYELSLLTKPTCYTQLHRLLSLGLVERVYVMDIKENTEKPVEKEILKKFKEWCQSMPQKLKRYYLAKTSYWVITSLGKKMGKNSCKFEMEFRENTLTQMGVKDGKQE